MRIVRWSAYFVLLLAFSLTSGYIGGSIRFAQAQTVPQSLEQGGTEAVMKNRKNNWTVGIVGGQLSGTYMTFANELAEVLDDSDNLRVIPIVTYGAASNLDDLLYLPIRKSSSRGVEIRTGEMKRPRPICLWGRPAGVPVWGHVRA